MIIYNIICKTQKITKMKHLTLPPTTSLRDLLTDAVNGSLAMDNIKAEDIISKMETIKEDDSISHMVIIKIPNIYPLDSVEHVEKNSDNFDRIVSDFISFLTGKSEPESFPLLLTSYDEQESILINISDFGIHIYYNNNGQY